MCYFVTLVTFGMPENFEGTDTAAPSHLEIQKGK